MKRLIDMEKQEVIGIIDWEFIYEMQGVRPELVNSEVITVTRELLGVIPPKWSQLVKTLAQALAERDKVFLAISDIDVAGDDYKVEGALKTKGGEALPFHKVVVMDKDLIEDDYIGGVITMADGSFSLSFDAETFNDFKWIKTKTIPHFLLKVFAWKANRFEKIAELKPKPHKVTKFEGKKYLIELGVIEV